MRPERRARRSLVSPGAAHCRERAPGYDERKWLNDPGDERDIPEEEELEDFYHMKVAPEQPYDKKFAARYAKWLKKQARNG